MSGLDGAVVANAAHRAGFNGDALVNIVAIGHRESGWDPTIQGDIGLMDATWGPSVGVWQIRTLRAESGTGGDRDLQALIPGAVAGSSGSGRPDLARQAAAAWSISGHGTDFSAWSTWRGLPQTDIDAAHAAISSAAAGSVAGDTIGGGSSAGLVGDLAGAIDRGLGAVLGYDGTFSDWAGMVIVRLCEVIAGGVIFAAGAVVFLDVVASGRPATPAGAGVVARSVRQGIALGKKAAMTAAAAA